MNLRFVVRALLILALAWAPSSYGQQSAVRAQDADPARESLAASRMRVSLERFREIARKQPSLHVAPDGVLIYKCARRLTPYAARNVGTDNSNFTGSPLPAFDLAQTFALHSRPGSDRVLYLDFNGHTLTDTGWNDGVGDPLQYAAFSIDNDPTTFNDAERRAIHQIWRRVAEDYAPFDIDVTTEDPGVNAIIDNGFGDTQVGIRALIGDDAGIIGENPNDGILGIAQLGSFGGAVDNPALSFSVSHNGDFALLADTIAHEVGHTLNLNHHGSDLDGEYYSGHGIWAPIMGSGPSTSVSQWSRGDYAGATNPFQDDLAVIGQTLNPMPFDHPVDQASAETLAVGDVAMGTLVNAADRAWYKFEASSGRATFRGSVSSLGPNLKLGLSIVDAQGTVLATSSTTAATLAANLTFNLPTTGTYYLVVDGIGYLDADTGFTDYASLGRYSVTGTWRLNQAPVASTAGSSPLLGRAPLAVTFDGRGSFDSDGTIASYAWSFSNGQTATGATPPPVTFATQGLYTATLTVTDNSGATNTTTVEVTATPKAAANRPISVASATTRWVTVSRTTGRGQAAFRIVDSAGRPLPGVTVRASLAMAPMNADLQVLTAVTDRAGNATFVSPDLNTADRPVLTFTVRSATLTPYAYLPARNKITTAVIRR